MPGEVRFPDRGSRQESTHCRRKVQGATCTACWSVGGAMAQVYKICLAIFLSICLPIALAFLAAIGGSDYDREHIQVQRALSGCAILLSLGAGWGAISLWLDLLLPRSASHPLRRRLVRGVAAILAVTGVCLIFLNIALVIDMYRVVQSTYLRDEIIRNATSFAAISLLFGPPLAFIGIQRLRQFRGALPQG
jgi:hypothetical protein